MHKSQTRGKQVGKFPMHLVLIQRGFQTEISIDLKIVILIWYFELLYGHPDAKRNE